MSLKGLNAKRQTCRVLEERVTHNGDSLSFVRGSREVSVFQTQRAPTSDDMERLRHLELGHRALKLLVKIYANGRSEADENERRAIVEELCQGGDDD